MKGFLITTRGGILSTFLFSLFLFTSCYNNNYVVSPDNNHYAELVYHNETTNLEILISNPNIYYNITGLECGHSSGIGCSENNLIINETGHYQMAFSVAFGGGANNEYEIELFVNDVDAEHCNLKRKLGTGGDVGSASFTCLEKFSSGDVIDLRVEDETNPTSNMDIHSLNLNVVRVGS